MSGPFGDDPIHVYRSKTNRKKDRKLTLLYLLTCTLIAVGYLLILFATCGILILCRLL